MGMVDMCGGTVMQVEQQSIALAPQGGLGQIGAERHRRRPLAPVLHERGAGLRCSRHTGAEPQ